MTNIVEFSRQIPSLWLILITYSIVFCSMSTNTIARFIFSFGIWIPTLDHETWNDTMKNGSIIESIFRMELKAFNMFGSWVGDHSARP